MGLSENQARRRQQDGQDRLEMWSGKSQNGIQRVIGMEEGGELLGMIDLMEQELIEVTALRVVIGMMKIVITGGMNRVIYYR